MVEFTAQGQVRPSVRAAEKLGTLGGLWRLVPDVGRMLLLERVGAAETSGRQVRLAGTFDNNNELHNALSMIAMGQQDGALHVSNGDCTKIFYFRKGVLLSARSSLPEDRFGNMLVRVGLLSAEDRDSCLPEVRAGQPLGTVLVSKGIMTTPQVYDGLRRQTEEIFYSVLPWQEGAFYLVAPLDMTEVPTMLHLNATGLLMDGVRILDEEGKNAPVDHDGGLHRIEPVPADELPEDGPTLIVETYNKALRGLFSAVGRQTAEHIKTSVGSFVQDSLPFHELFFGVTVADDGSLSTKAIIDNLGEAPSEAAIRNMQLGLCEVLFFALFAAGEEVTPELEHEIHGQVAAQLKDLPSVREEAAPGAVNEGVATAKVNLAKLAATMDVREGESLIDDEMIAQIFDDDDGDEDVAEATRTENSVIAAIVDEEFAVESLADEVEPMPLDALAPDDSFELSLDQDEEIMSLLDKVAEAQAEEAAKSRQGTRLVADDEDDADTSIEALE